MPALAGAIISSSCTKHIYIDPQPLPLPPVPTYPRISSDELQCLADDTYVKLVERSELQNKALSECRAVIESTHSE